MPPVRDPARMLSGSNGRRLAALPILLILLALVEYINGTNTLVQAAGATIVVARLCHAIGMARPAPNLFRVIGMLGIFLPLLALSAWAVFLAV